MVKGYKVKVGYKYVPEKEREEKRKAGAEALGKETKRVNELDNYDFMGSALFPSPCC
jgi:hypothetical protein